jgi:NAD(P)-dependent dehydrogenase (short-subunit alcohol dehydrogenase family)
MKKNILIIGGSSGVGLALVKLLCEENNVIVASRTNETISDLPISYLPFDVEKDDLDISKIPDQLNGFVYCPGSINLRPFKGIKQEVFIQDFSINVLGAIKTLQAVQNNLQNSETPSSVVLFSTVAVRTGMPFHSSVATAKGALEGLARSLAAELAPKIRFNVIAPSLVDTRMAEKFLNNETKKNNAASRHPLQRVGNAKEIAQMAKFLISDESSWMTAQTLTIDGGIGSIKS